MAQRYFGPRQLLDASIATTMAKREYETHPERRADIVARLRQHPVLKPRLYAIAKRFGALEDEVRKKFKDYPTQLQNEREFDKNPLAAVRNLNLRLDPEEAREWLFFENPRKAHRYGIRALEGSELQEYRRKRKRDPPLFRRRDLNGGVHITLRPWGVHFAFEEEKDYERIFLKGSAGQTSANPNGIKVSYSVGAKKPESETPQKAARFFEQFSEYERLSRHELDHGFFHSIFTGSPVRARAAFVPDYEPIAARLPAFLNARQRKAMKAEVVALLAHRGPWTLRNEFHSYLNHGGGLRELTMDQMMETETKNVKRVPSVYRRPSRRIGYLYRKLERMFRRKEFANLSESQKLEIRQWLSDEKTRIRSQLDANLHAILKSRIPTGILASAAMLIPFHKMARAVKAMDRVYRKHQGDYEKKFEGTHLNRPSFMERMFRMAMESRMKELED